MEDFAAGLAGSDGGAVEEVVGEAFACGAEGLALGDALYGAGGLVVEDADGDGAAFAGVVVEGEFTFAAEFENGFFGALADFFEVGVGGAFGGIGEAVDADLEGPLCGLAEELFGAGEVVFGDGALLALGVWGREEGGCEGGFVVDDGGVDASEGGGAFGGAWT